MTPVKKLALVALMATGATVGVATAATAGVACNREGECWHTRRAYAYAPEYGVVYHPNGWRWGHGEAYRWREHPGRGYWRGGAWVPF